jgi:DNA-binding response OmpR family regulator
LKVLLIEDNQQIANDISFCLGVGYPDVNVVRIVDEQEALKVAKSGSLDLVILDSGGKRISSLNLIEQIRRVSDVPLLVLSESETDMEKAKGLEAGADEYVNKPFSPIELLARCRALLRRAQKQQLASVPSISLKELTLNFETREVSIANRPVKLTSTEYNLLSELVKNHGKVVTNEELLGKIWGPACVGNPNLVKMYIYRLRTKLGAEHNKAPQIHNEHGVGYRLIAPLSCSIIGIISWLSILNLFLMMAR